MYKTQLKFQKIICFLCVAAAVVLFLYSLGIMTDLYDALYPGVATKVVEDPDNPGGYIFSITNERVPGASMYIYMQTFNQYLVKYAIVYIILAVLLFATSTASRRRYYVSNYVSIGLFTAASIYIPLFAHGYIEEFKAQFQAIDKEALLKLSQTYKSTYTESTLWFDLHYVVFAIMLLVAVALVACCVWKVVLMRDERKLVEEGKKVKA